MSYTTLVKVNNYKWLISALVLLSSGLVYYLFTRYSTWPYLTSFDKDAILSISSSIMLTFVLWIMLEVPNNLGSLNREIKNIESEMRVEISNVVRFLFVNKGKYSQPEVMLDWISIANQLTDRAQKCWLITRFAKHGDAVSKIRDEVKVIMDSDIMPPLTEFYERHMKMFN